MSEKFKYVNNKNNYMSDEPNARALVWLENKPKLEKSITISGLQLREEFADKLNQVENVQLLFGWDTSNGDLALNFKKPREKFKHAFGGLFLALLIIVMFQFQVIGFAAGFLLSWSYYFFSRFMEHTNND